MRSWRCGRPITSFEAAYAALSAASTARRPPWAFRPIRRQPREAAWQPGRPPWCRARRTRSSCSVPSVCSGALSLASNSSTLEVTRRDVERRQPAYAGASWAGSGLSASTLLKTRTSSVIYSCTLDLCSQCARRPRPMEDVTDQAAQQPPLKNVHTREPLDVVKLTRHIFGWAVVVTMAFGGAAAFQQPEWVDFFKIGAGISAAVAASSGVLVSLDGIIEIKNSKDRAAYVLRGIAILLVGLGFSALTLPAVFRFAPIVSLFNHERPAPDRKESEPNVSDKPGKTDPSSQPPAPLPEKPAKAQSLPMPPAASAEKQIELSPSVRTDKAPPPLPPLSNEASSVPPALSPSRPPETLARKSEAVPAPPLLLYFYLGEPRNVCGQSQLTIRRSMRNGWVLYSADILSKLREVPLVVGQPVTIGDCELTLHPIEPDPTRFDFDWKVLSSSK